MTRWNYTFNSELFYDIDGDKIEYSILYDNYSIEGTWLEYDVNTYTISGTSSLDDKGEHTITIIATDEYGGQEYITFI